MALASVNVASHGHNIDLVDAPRIHVAIPAPRWRQDQSHAWPWPGSERTANQLAAILQHAAGKRAGQRRARIEQLARTNAVSRGHNIDLVDVRTLPRIHIAVPAPG